MDGARCGRVTGGTATAPRGSRFGAPQELASSSCDESAPDLEQLAVTPDGVVGVAFEEHGPTAGDHPGSMHNAAIRVAFQPVGSVAFGPAETIAEESLPSVYLYAPPALGLRTAGTGLPSRKPRVCGDVARQR